MELITSETNLMVLPAEAATLFSMQSTIVMAFKAGPTTTGLTEPKINMISPAAGALTEIPELRVHRL